MRSKHSTAAYTPLEALGHVLRTQSRKARRPQGSGGVFGDWRLGVDEAGNLIATHGPSGHITVLAAVPVEEVETDG